ncbi:MAG: acylphosphatase, partial [Desulfuromonadales bacterium]|nr:acylphosphatase [Desulfuromonadales bacterium]
MKPIRATVRIRGRVQGVSFRYYTSRTAEAHQVTGWVRNLPDGDVEAVFEGGETAVRQLLDWCRQGPAGARVEELSIHWEEYRGEFDG